MEIVDVEAMAWGENLVPHRQGNMAHKQIFSGEENSPDNFALVLAKESADYYSPGHRHNWDQLRYCLEGSVPIGRGMKVGAGELAYFPEGVAYGPQEGGPDRLVLVLQFGGASGQGYMSVEQASRARQALLEEGRFEGGVFRRRSGAGKKNQDAYEAIWQRSFGQPVTYPEPRYRAPIVMRPAAFAFDPLSDSGAVRIKRLGVFPHRGLELEILQIDAAASYRLQPRGRRRLLFVLEGSGNCADADYAGQTAVRLEPGEGIDFAAAARTEMLIVSVAVLAAARN